MHTTSSTDPRADPTSSGTGSPWTEAVMISYMPRAGERGALDSMRSWLGMLVAMVRHPFGNHDYVAVIEIVTDCPDHGLCEHLSFICWLCQSRDLST